MTTTLQSLQGLPAYALVLGLLVGSGFGLPVNEDILLMVAAALTLQGVMEPLPLIATAWVGVLCADTLVFHWGHLFGARLLNHRFMARLIPPQRLLAMQSTMRRYGPGYIFVARFLPGMRTALYFAAGSLKMPYRQMVLYDGAAAAIELPLLVFGVRYVGGRWDQIAATVQRHQAWLLPAGVVAIIGLVIFLRARRRARLR